MHSASSGNVQMTCMIHHQIATARDNQSRSNWSSWHGIHFQSGQLCDLSHESGTTQSRLLFSRRQPVHQDCCKQSCQAAQTWHRQGRCTSSCLRTPSGETRGSAMTAKCPQGSGDQSSDIIVQLMTNQLKWPQIFAQIVGEMEVVVQEALQSQVKMCMTVKSFADQYPHISS